ncbi:MAG: ATP-binding domain-containing protein, partial [Planctomycetes bacterium]|nr:ATP-binding domain-containing protein [Planctomycetota bacterium]
EALADELLAAVRAEADDALAGLGRLRILAASRHGERGTAAWNARVEALLAARGVRADDPWYPGRPALVTANDYQNRIFNGDLGVACRAADGRPQVAFRAPDGSTRRVSAFRLPAHETAWAMTVHKSQGSEFDTVVLSMPESDGPLWQAPLLYTGITSARRRALLIGDEELLRSGVGRWPNRSSGLADALAAQ